LLIEFTFHRMETLHFIEASPSPGAASDEVILNILARRREPPRPPTIITAEDLTLARPPVANCARYDSLRDTRAAA